MENRNKPAYPSTYLNEKGNADYSEGLSKREIIAAMALQGLCGSKPAINIHHSDAEIMANRAVILADALLTQLEKKG